MTENVLLMREHPELLEQAAMWFHEKWGVPLEAYLESMRDCIQQKAPVPQWYLYCKNEKIVAGLGVIENDFHDRKDLAPNVCAVYVEKAERRKGIAGTLLQTACEDMAGFGLKALYLLTDHTSFYERYGWEFFCMAQGNGEPEPSRIYRHVL